MRFPVHSPRVCSGLLGLGFLLSAASAAALELAPYTPDPFTLHLWHLDENGPPFADQVESGLALQGLLRGAKAGIPSAGKLGTCVSFSTLTGGYPGSNKSGGAILLAASELHNHGGDNVPDSFRYFGSDGAFTIEALVRFDMLPGGTSDIAGGLVTMDGEAENRVFNFRVEKSGFLAFIPLHIQGVASGGALAAIPTTGPHAVNTNDWFHIAVSYDGNEGSANNLTLFWTRLDQAREAAHVIGRGSLTEDFSRVSDFAIGNEARGHTGEEPFPGRIDEVRISSVARDPSDFLFVPPVKRRSPDQVRAEIRPAEPLEIELYSWMVDGLPVEVPAGSRLKLPPGTHRLDFDFGVDDSSRHAPARFRCRLRGLEEQWAESGRGMSLTCEVLDDVGEVISLIRRPILGTSAGWRTGPEDSEFRRWSEPLFIPGSASMLRIVFSSGADDTAGVCLIDDLEVLRHGLGGGGDSIWANPGFDNGDRTRFPHGVPSEWKRGGSAPNIARLVHFENDPALALVDGDQAASGSWTSIRPLPRPASGGETLTLRGREMFHVIGGNRHRATFTNVPPGDYAFEVTAIDTHDFQAGAHAEFPFTIGAPVTSRPWFWAVIATCIVGSTALGILAMLRQGAARKLNLLRIQNALARDRARIARDMHDDLGTRITLLTMNASLAQRDFAKSPEAARRHLGNLNSAARSLVTAMDDMVWAIDPQNDTLDHLAEHIVRLAEEVFRDSGVHFVADIPPILPERKLHSDFRHHLALAVKESLHNILRHAGPCDASLRFGVAGDSIEIVIEDHGHGFDPAAPEAGNGLANLRSRLSELGGSCLIESSLGKGTRVVMRCPLPPGPPEKTAS
jgi:signal transduction histidine kinase